MPGRRNWNLQECLLLLSENAMYLAESVLVLILIAWFFYRSVIAFLVLLPLLIPLIRFFQNRHRQRKQDELRKEFKELMGSVQTSMRAGDSAESAFREALPEMIFLYGKGSMICKELHRMIRELDSHIPLEEALMDFAQKIHMEEATDFAEVFAIAKRNGGSMTEILGRTIYMIQSKTEAETQIRVLVRSRSLEQHIMDAVPFGIAAYIDLTSEGMLDSLYHNASGIAVMTGCLSVYAAALVLSEKILDIRV